MKSRQLEILLYLIELKKTTYTELAEKFEVSKKTIERDIDRLSFMGVPIYTQQGYKGGVYIEANYKFSKSFFTKEEIRDIILALNIMDNINKNGKKEKILGKLKMILPEQTILQNCDFEEYLKIELVEEEITAEQKIYQNIDLAFEEEVYIDVYFSDSKMRIAPISFILRNNGLYLYYFNKNDYGILDLHNVYRCSMTDEEFDRDKFKKYEEYKKD